MSKFRTYLSKNNTIINGSYLNTAKNEVVELFYGNLKDLTIQNVSSGQTIFSRILIAFDFENLQSHISKNYLTKDVIETHKFKMWNTINLKKELIGEKMFDNSNRAYGVNVNMYKIDEPWIEGVGHDFVYNNNIYEPTLNSMKASNWYEKNLMQNWDNPGVIFSGSTLIGSCFFANGDENLEIDVTNDINSYLFSGATNFGYILSYDVFVEQTDDEVLNKLSFFSKYTQTFFEPYLETSYNSVLSDDRSNFKIDKDNKLFVKTNVLPTGVTIYDNCNYIYDMITDVKNFGNNFYWIDLKIPAEQNYPDLVMFRDDWKTISDSFVLLEKENENFEDLDEYFITLTNLGELEKIKPHGIRKIGVNAKTMSNKYFDKKIKYRLYVKQGQTEIEIIPFTQINKFKNSMFFYLYLSWLIPQRYYLDLVVFDAFEMQISKNFTYRFDITNNIL